jgi:capsid protein
MDAQGYRQFMAFFSRKALSPIFRRWMDMAVLSGAVTAPTYAADPRFWQRHRWMPSGWTRGINPTQEVAASEQSMKNYTTSLAEECAWYGRDWKAVLRQAAKIERMKAQLGLPSQLFAKEPAAAAPGEDTEDTEEAEELEKQGAAK